MYNHEGYFDPTAGLAVKAWQRSRIRKAGRLKEWRPMTYRIGVLLCFRAAVIAMFNKAVPYS